MEIFLSSSAAYWFHFNFRLWYDSSQIFSFITCVFFFFIVDVVFLFIIIIIFSNSISFSLRHYFLSSFIIHKWKERRGKHAALHIPRNTSLFVYAQNVSISMRLYHRHRHMHNLYIFTSRRKLNTDGWPSSPASYNNNITMVFILNFLCTAEFPMILAWKEIIQAVCCMQIFIAQIIGMFVRIECKKNRINQSRGYE